MVSANILAGCIALLSALMLPWRRPSNARPALILCLSAAGWCFGAAWRGASDGTQTDCFPLIMGSAGIAASAAFTLSRRLVHGRWRIPVPVMIAFVAEPIMIAAATWRQLGYDQPEDFRVGPAFMIHSLYSFGLLIGVIITLSARQRDANTRVRNFVMAAQITVGAVITLEVAASPHTQFLVAAGAVLVVWAVRHPDDWLTSASRADQLMNSIGVFLLVFDRDGLLKDWNGQASRLLELVTGRAATRGTAASQILGRHVPFPDNQLINLDVRGGSMRVSATIHSVDPTEPAAERDWVVMLRPVKSSIGGESFPSLSGALDGYDPATQTYGRRTTLETLRSAIVEDLVAIRISVIPADFAVLEDEVMFVVARRLEAIAPDVQWGRLEEWSFAAALPAETAARTKETIDLETQMALGLSAETACQILVPAPGEDAGAFIRRVESAGPPPGTAQRR